MRPIVTLVASLALANTGKLHQTARLCDADRMRQLLSRNPSLNETDETGLTPLHIAVDSRQKACVWLLLKAGADRNARDRSRFTETTRHAPVAHCWRNVQRRNTRVPLRAPAAGGHGGGE